VALGLLTLGGACVDRQVAPVAPSLVKESRQEFISSLTRDLDILFMVDNSTSMEDKQRKLRNNFSTLINTLKNLPGGLPNLHIGVTTSDMGSGAVPDTQGDCTVPGGNNGRLVNTARPSAEFPGCTAPADKFIIDRDDPNNPGTRIRNYTGTLESTFACIANVGVGGCRYESQLEAVRAALDGRNPETQQFLRPNAALAIIFITDEDDCSVKNPELYTQDPGLSSLNGTVGPIGSYRCTDFGIKCANSHPNHAIDRQTVGLRTQCTPDETSPYLYPTQDYVDFYRGLKNNVQGRVVVGAIAGPTIYTDISTRAVTAGAAFVDFDVLSRKPFVRDACRNADSSAAAAFRLEKVVNAFSGYSAFTSICANDFASALGAIGQTIAGALSKPCLAKQPADTDPNTPGIQAECNVTDVLNPGTDTQEEVQTIPACPGDGTRPCFTMVYDSTECTSGPRIEVQIDRRGASAPPGTSAVVRCLTN
jgi:hypothetical protein